MGWYCMGFDIKPSRILLEPQTHLAYIPDQQPSLTFSIPQLWIYLMLAANASPNTNES